MEHSENTKVYRFDLELYKKSNLRKRITYSILVVIFATLLFMSYITTYDSPFFLLLSLLLYIILLYFKVFKDFVAYLRAGKTHKDDNITIQKENGQIVSIKSQICDNKYNKYYSIKSISQVDHKKYIDIIGDIQADYTHKKHVWKSKSEHRSGMRIPACFENMDEIYSELENMKEQS